MFQGPKDRQVQIAERVRQNGFLTVSALADQFGVTTQTIRRDIAELSDKGVIKRRHGGVELPIADSNLAFEDRETLNFAAKDLIASTVAGRIPDGASLAIGIGTTPAMVVRHLQDHRGLKIVTNNIAAAMAACALTQVEVHIPGGSIRTSAQDVLGAEVVGFFERFKVDIGVYGVGGVDAGTQLLDFHSDEVEIRETIRRNCRSAFLVLDATKFGRAAFVRGGDLSDADLVFSDANPPAEAVRALAARGREFVLCDGSVR